MSAYQGPPGGPRDPATPGGYCLTLCYCGGCPQYRARRGRAPAPDLSHTLAARAAGNALTAPPERPLWEPSEPQRDITERTERERPSGAPRGFLTPAAGSLLELLRDAAGRGFGGATASELVRGSRLPRVEVRAGLRELMLAGLAAPLPGRDRGDERVYAPT